MGKKIRSIRIFASKAFGTRRCKKFSILQSKETLGLKQKRRDPDSGTRGKQKPERKIDSKRRYQYGCKMTASRVDPR